MKVLMCYLVKTDQLQNFSINIKNKMTIKDRLQQRHTLLNKGKVHGSQISFKKQFQGFLYRKQNGIWILHEAMINFKVKKVLNNQRTTKCSYSFLLTSAFLYFYSFLHHGKAFKKYTW